MDGVTILNTYTENVSTINYVILLILSVFILIFSAIGIYVVSEKFSDFNGYTLFYTIILALSAAVLIISIIELKTPPKEPQTLYEVTVSDDVSFTEFMDKYIIIEQRGEIYIVKEHKQNNKENQNQ